MTCLTCKHGALKHLGDPKVSKAVADMARQGFARCALSFGGSTFHALGHTCRRWAEAPAEVIAARRRWLEREGVATC